jgi:tight adherence protein C
VIVWAGATMSGLALASLVLALGSVGGRGRFDQMIDARSPDRAPNEPPAGHRLMERIGRSPFGLRRLSLGATMALEGAGWNLSADWFAGVRTLAVGSAVLAGLTLPMPAPLLTPAVAAAALRLPTILAARAGRRRRAAMDAEIPQLLDLLAAASSAGISAQLALRRAAAAVRGPLAAELERVLRAIDLGARWRDELRGWADRLQLQDLGRTVVALCRTDTLGASLETSTAELAASVRAARRAAVTERARAAPVKMLFPLVFLVLPAFLLLTVVPVLLTTLQSIR